MLWSVTLQAKIEPTISNIFPLTMLVNLSIRTWDADTV